MLVWVLCLRVRRASERNKRGRAVRGKRRGSVQGITHPHPRNQRCYHSSVRSLLHGVYRSDSGARCICVWVRARPGRRRTNRPPSFSMPMCFSNAISPCLWCCAGFIWTRSWTGSTQGPAPVPYSYRVPAAPATWSGVRRGQHTRRTRRVRACMHVRDTETRHQETGRRRSGITMFQAAPDVRSRLDAAPEKETRDCSYHCASPPAPPRARLPQCARPTTHPRPRLPPRVPQLL